jgi:hypothetical protein
MSTFPFRAMRLWVTTLPMPFQPYRTSAFRAGTRIARFEPAIALIPEARGFEFVEAASPTKFQGS